MIKASKYILIETQFNGKTTLNYERSKSLRGVININPLSRLERA